jgi:L-amino acid N-acyltransferase YncA
MPATLRLAAESDAEQVHAIYAPIVVHTVISFEFEPPAVGEMRARIASTLPRYPWMVCVSEGQVLGYAYASSHHTRAAYQWAVDVSAYVAPGCRRAGVGRALYTVLFQILHAQGFYSAHAGITLPNPASVGLHEAMGFLPVGVYRAVGYKLGGWYDVGWWQYDLQPRQLDPATPLPLDAVVASPEWAGMLASGLPLLHLPTG